MVYPDSPDTEYILIYQSINTLSIDIVCEAFNEAGIPYAIRHAGRIYGTQITIPATQLEKATELLEMLPIRSHDEAGIAADITGKPERPWVNKVFLIALIYTGIIALLYYLGQK